MSWLWTLLAVLAVLGVFSVGWYKYIYAKDYWLYADVKCNENGEDCSTIKIKAYAAPMCDEWKGDCPELSCDGLTSDQCIMENQPSMALQ